MATDALAALNALRARRLQGRQVVLGLMFVGMIISYLDRTNISVVGPTLAKELKIGPTALGMIFLRICLDICNRQSAGRFHG